jgi:hypothetical protein
VRTHGWPITNTNQTARPQDAANRPENGGQVGDVHQRKLAGHAVEAAVIQRRQMLRVIQNIAQRGRAAMAPGKVEHRLGAVDADHLGGAGGRQRSGRHPLSAGEVSDDLAADIAGQLERASQRRFVRSAARCDQLVVPGSDLRPAWPVGFAHMPSCQLRSTSVTAQ